MKAVWAAQPSTAATRVTRPAPPPPPPPTLHMRLFFSAGSLRQLTNRVKKKETQ